MVAGVQHPPFSRCGTGCTRALTWHRLKTPGRPARREPLSSADYPRRGKCLAGPLRLPRKGKRSLKPPKPKGCRTHLLVPAALPAGPAAGQGVGNIRRRGLAGEPGFEPRLTESESAVLPLNYSPSASLDAVGKAVSIWWAPSSGNRSSDQHPFCGILQPSRVRHVPFKFAADSGRCVASDHPLPSLATLKYARVGRPRLRPAAGDRAGKWSKVDRSRSVRRRSRGREPGAAP